ncbi:MAG: IS4 family transposase, partial [Planctomycetaceae bacterium]|nr:IS4 family transposase [Planctomycetaceae bacterium]
MSHQDRHAGSVRVNSVCLREALQWLMRGVNWSGVVLRDDCTWTPRWLAAGALLWAWSNEDTLAERFACSRRLIGHQRADSIEPAGSYQAFLKLLQRWTNRLLAVLQQALRQRMQEFSGAWRLHGFVVFGVDGSRIDLPRTRSHEAAYAPSRSRSPKTRRARRRPRSAAGEKKARQAQLWLTTMYHVALHLPWDWRIGPSDSSERAHAREMLDTLPADALLTADAGFVGYDFAQAVLAGGRQLLVRVGSNVTLLKQLGYVRESAGTVYLWTDQAASRRDEPLVFRHVVVQGPRHPLHLIVSVLSPRRLSDRQVAALYRARWGVEVFYRHLKQTFGRRKLRSCAAANARVELEWSLVGLWSIGLYATAELIRRQIPL